MNAARSAEISAKITREKLNSIDLLAELNRLNGRIDDLMLRLDGGAWELVSERATDLRVSIAAIAANLGGGISEDVRQRLLVSVTQFKNIAAGAGRANADGKPAPSVSRYQSIVADQKETIVLAMQAVKSHMGEK